MEAFEKEKIATPSLGTVFAELHNRDKDLLDNALNSKGLPPLEALIGNTDFLDSLDLDIKKEIAFLCSSLDTEEDNERRIKMTKDIAKLLDL